MLDPLLSVECTAASQNVHLRHNSPDSSLVSRKLLETRTITIASPGYPKRYGAPESPRDLQKHACILVRDHQTGQPIEQWVFRHGNKVERIKAAGRVMVADFGTLLGACVQGVGFARVKAIWVQRHIEQRELIELLSSWKGGSYPLYALYASRHLPPAKIRVFLDFIDELILDAGTEQRAGPKTRNAARL